LLPGQPLPGKAPTTLQKGPFPTQQGSVTSPANPRPPLPQFQHPLQSGGPAPHLDTLQKARQTRVEDGGRRTVIVEPGSRTIIKQDNRIVIRHDDGERFRLLAGANAHSERKPDGLVETYYLRRDGVRIVSVVDANGRLVRRYRRGGDGREFNIIDNRRYWAAAGVGALAIGVLLVLPPPVVTLPPERYIVAYDRASADDLYDALSADPIEPLERAYSLEEIRDNYGLRQRLRRIDLDTINFEFGSWQVAEEQYPRLEAISQVILRLLDRNPDEVFLIAAYTDAVGSDVDNLSLSDRRAQSVAEILSASFGVPPENLVTQGYGAQFLKIDTPGPEPRNRRVEIQRITPLLAQR
jgi:outer membrane protein OmpA-like peptidoglycan-associated protein